MVSVVVGEGGSVLIDEADKTGLSVVGLRNSLRKS